MPNKGVQSVKKWDTVTEIAKPRIGLAIVYDAHLLRRLRIQFEYACNSLTNFEYEIPPFTGNGNTKVALKNSWNQIKLTEVNLFLEGFTEIVKPRIEPAIVFNAAHLFRCNGFSLWQ